MSRSNDLASLADEATGGITKGEVGLGNVDNTADADKPVSTATTTALNLKANIAGPTFTGTVGGVTKTHVGLGNVDNTADSAKPVSTAQQTEIDKLAYQGEPHIIPNMLYPAIDGKGIDGTTTVSSFGTDVTINGRTLQYYYTNIKGSKPIRDPRIGAHFGSQRHKFKSLQLLEQETATQGQNVYSIDGREWIRACGNEWVINNNTHGNFLENSTATITNDTIFIEVVGYFNDANVLHWASGTDEDQFGITINGGTRQSNNLNMGEASPLSGRCVDSGSVVNALFNSTPTLGINTLRISNTNGAYYSNFGIELIAQDTADTTRRNHVLIPAQSVVSYGKKFSVGSDTLTNAVHKHYNPFAFKTDGSSAWASGAHNGTSLPVGTGSSHNIDTATSLGLENWKHTDGNYYKPYNGGRVVLWIDNTGVLKTSVTVMPPLAKSIADSNNLTPSAQSITAASANSEYRPYFGQNDAYDASGKEAHGGLHEVAKTFHFREFGNGSANGGTGGTYADASMLNTTDDIAYVMDDGLTSLTGDNVKMGGQGKDLIGNATNDGCYITFIGTGLTLKNTESSPATDHLVQNLPYGTHVVKYLRGGDPYNPILTVDGVTITCSTANFAEIHELTFHQPKRPPIPEEAVIISDYCLMADYVANTGTGQSAIGKGVRFVDASRDIFYDQGGSTWQLQMLPDIHNGARVFNDASSTSDYKLPFFGHGITYRSQSHSDRVDEAVFKINGDVYDTNFNSAGNYVAGNRIGTTSPNPWDTSNNDGTFTFRHSSSTNREEFVGVKELQLGLNELHIDSPQYINVTTGMEVHTPIHTSHHYQTFETPFLHELIGGDRNMEQTNLIVTPDGRTWDQLTRDTSYIGNIALQCETDGDTNTNTPSAVVIFDEWRGKGLTAGADAAGSVTRNLMNKYFAIAYDRMICLKDGQYEIIQSTFLSDALNGSAWGGIFINGDEHVSAYNYDTNYNQNTIQALVQLKRGDYIQYKGVHFKHGFGTFYIKKI